MDLVGLPYKDKKVFAQYSLGMKQRLAIALAIMHDPELLILDEPINGLDPIGIAEVRAFIRQLCDEKGKTILLSSHILSEIALLADDIGIIDYGISAVSRMSFVFAKLAIWFLWYVVLLAYIEIITVWGSNLLYPAQFSADSAKMVIVMFSKFGLLTFITLVPLLWVTILQKKLFYPSILAAIGFTGILLGGFNVSMEMIFPASIVPWTAVSLIAIYQVESPYILIGIISIVLTGIIGLFLTIRSIYKQDQ